MFGENKVKVEKWDALDDFVGNADNGSEQGRNQREKELMMRERELLDRERELLTRERELLTRSVNHSTVKQPRSDFAEKLLPEFDPEKTSSMTAKQWIRRVESVSTAYEWDKSMIFTHAVGKLNGSAKLWFDSVMEEVTTWDEFKTQLAYSFQTVDDVADVHMLLSKRKKEKNESFETYVYSMKAIGKRGELDNNSLVKYILNGIADRELARSLAVCEFDDVEELLRKIKRYENMFERSKANNTGHHEIRQNRERPTTATTSGTVTKKCFKCNSPNHLAKECSERRPSKGCFRCGDESHFSRNCTRKVNESSEKKNVLRIETEEEAAIKDEYHKIVHIDTHPIKAFLDLGSDCTTMKITEAEKRGINYIAKQIQLSGFGGGQSTTLGYRTSIIEIDNTKIESVVHIVPDEAQDEVMILGRNILRDPNIVVIARHNNVEIRQNEVASDEFTSQNDQQQKVSRIKMEIPLEEIKCNDNVPENQKQQLSELITTYRGCFAQNMNEIGCSKSTEMTIELTTDEIVRYKPYRIAYPKRETVRNTIQELLDAGIVRPSTSEYASPILMVKKKTGEERLCVDYRRLNLITKKEYTNPTIVEEQLEMLRGKKIFTSLDLSSGYYQIPVAKESKHLTAFVTTDGHWEFNKMPFGLVNAPAVFTRMMKNKVMKQLEGLDILIYMDDLLVPSSTIEEGLLKLERVFMALQEEGLTLKLKKCKFFEESAEYLGFEITNGGIRPGEAKIAAVQEFKEPTNAHEVRQFCGLASYFRKFVKGHAELTKPLTQLLRKEAKFEWGHEQKESFTKIKEALTKRPLLVIYDPHKNQRVYTDASSTGLAGILLQDEGQKEWKPIAYFSRQTNEQERKYHSYELEALAVVESIERYRVYLYGKHFEVYTDCNALKTTMTKRDLIPRIGRWWLKLQEYDFELFYRPGFQMGHADALSRNPHESPREPEIADLKVMTLRINQEDWLVTMQSQDKEMNNVRDSLNRPVVTNEDRQIRQDYVLKNNRIYRKDKGKLLWAVPRAVRWRIIRSCHDEAGHYGLEKTVQNIRNHFWFARMTQHVKKYIAACIECAYHKQKSGKKEGEYHNIPREPIPFYMVHMDHLGPFPESKRKNTHVIALIDGFTKYIVIKAVKSTKTLPTCKFFKEVIETFGAPHYLVTDRGTAFTAEKFETFCEDNDVRHIKNATATPRANGQIERYNKTMLTAITTMAHEKRDWDDQIKQIQWNLNSMKNKTTKRSAHELLFGYHPRNALQNKLILVLEEDHENYLEEDLETRRNNALEQIQADQVKQKKHYDQKHKSPTQYQEGDLVMVERESAATGQSKKLKPKYKGPYLIKTKLGNDRYVLVDVPGAQRTQRPFESVFASERMKLWCTLPEDEDSGSSDERTEDDDDVPERPKTREQPGDAETSSKVRITEMSDVTGKSSDAPKVKRSKRLQERAARIKGGVANKTLEDDGNNSDTMAIGDNG